MFAFSVNFKWHFSLQWQMLTGSHWCFFVLGLGTKGTADPGILIFVGDVTFIIFLHGSTHKRGQMLMER